MQNFLVCPVKLVMYKTFAKHIRQSVPKQGGERKKERILQSFLGYIQTQKESNRHWSLRLLSEIEELETGAKN